MSMMFEDRKGYAIVESMARDAVAKLDPLLRAPSDFRRERSTRRTAGVFPAL